MKTGSSGTAAQMLQEARDDVQHADQKASLLLAAAGVGFGVIISGQMSSDWRADTVLSMPGQILWGFGIALAVACITAAAVAVWPRYRLETMPRYGVTYWGHVAAFKDPYRLGTALAKTDTDARARERVLHQLWSLSRIVLRKYRWIRVSLLLGAGAGVALSAAVVFFPAGTP